MPLTIPVVIPTDPEVVRDTMGAALVGGTNVKITPNDALDTITVDGAQIIAGLGIGAVVDAANNTITISNTSGGATFNVDIYPDDQTGTVVMDTKIATAVAAVNALYSTARGSHTATMRFTPGNFRVTDLSVFDPLVLAATAKRSVTIAGPQELGKRASLIIVASSVGASTDQVSRSVFKFCNNRQFTVRDIGFRSENSNQILFHHYCNTISDEGSLYPEFPASSAQNSGRYRRIYVEGDWDVVCGFDGGIRANLNSEMGFSDWTLSNSLTCTTVFRWGFKLRDGAYLSTGISAPTAGTFTLTYNGQTTSALAYNASAATIQAALEGLSTIGSGNVVVTASSAPTAGSYVLKFVNAMKGVFDGTLLTTATAGWGGVSWKVFLYPPQQDQFLNYHFENMELEFKSGNVFEINRGGTIVLSGYNSIILGTNSGVGGTIFVMPEIATHADDACSLVVQGNFRPELRVSTAKFMDCAWHGVNKNIRIGPCKISVTAISGGPTGSTVKAMETIRFSNAIDAQQMPVTFDQVEIPGYVTIANAATGANSTASDIAFHQCRFKSWTSPTFGLFASQSALAADTTTAIRALGSALIYNRGSYGNAGAPLSLTGTKQTADGSVSV